MKNANDQNFFNFVRGLWQRVIRYSILNLLYLDSKQSYKVGILKIFKKCCLNLLITINSKSCLKATFI